MFPSAMANDLPALRGGRAAIPSPLPRLPRVTRIPAEATPSVARAVRIRGLVDEHFSFVWRYLHGLGIPDAQVDDVAQQVFVIASQKIDAIQVGSERSFLVGTARGVAANARRADIRRREVVGEGVLDAVADDAPDAEARAETRQGLAILDRFLSSLSDELGEIFILFELEGWTMAAIAEALDLPAGTVASRLRRAREAFQEMAKRFQAARAHEENRHG
jgi:RNA polymerase sigma-70 factor (ECF subfamily)